MGETNVRANASEKIILACNNIQWINFQLSHLRASYELVAGAQKDPELKNSLLEGIKRHEAILEAAAEKLTPILEDLSDYLNACDAVTKIDERVLSPGNEVVLLGMDEYEKDYSDPY